MRALPLILALCIAPACIGFSGGVIPDSGRFAQEPDETATPEDTDTLELPAWMGTGDDGALELSEHFVLDEDLHGGREWPDAVHYAVQSISGATVTTSEEAQGLAAGDEAVLINLGGIATDYGTVGAWALVEIAAVDGATVELGTDPGVLFAEAGNEDLGGQTVVLQRVPNYTNVTLHSGATLTVTPWDRSGGGLMFLRATGGLHVQGSAAIDLTGLGYDGGRVESAGCDGYQGESIAGGGLGGACGGSYNEGIGADAANMGGGGCNITGAGGGHGSYGLPGEAWSSGYSAPSGGNTYGDEALTALHLGSGGGGVWNGSDGTEAPGGDGGGIAVVAAASITVDDGGEIRTLGSDTAGWSTGSYSYGAGGGAGGTLWLITQVLSAAEHSLIARGGAGESSHDRYGGDGGDGRVRVDCQVCNGAEHASSEATEALALASDPDPGFSEAPE